VNHPLPDGFLKLADQLERRAAGEADPGTKQSLLESAVRMRRIDEQARAVLDQARQVQANYREYEQRRRAAERALYAATIAFVWLLALLRGFGAATLGMAAGFSLLLVAAWYFQSRSIDARETRAEKAAAWTWLALRTLVGVAGVALFLGVPAAALMAGRLDLLYGARLGSLVVSCLLGLLCIWVGFAGWSRDPVRDLRLRRQRLWGDRPADGPRPARDHAAPR
jgi:hypothetical protein